MSQQPEGQDSITSSDNFDKEGLCQPGSENTGRWTSDEHRLFLKGLELHGKGWKQIATLIQTRTVVQIRTHAQKYFQKLSKAQASGTSHLDPATLMSTMDAGKPRPSSIARNLRSSTFASNAAESEGRLMSLRKRRNRGRHPRHGDDQEDTNSESSSDYGRGTTRTRRRRRSSSSSSGGGGGGGGSSESEEEGGGGHHGVEGYGETQGAMMLMARQEAEEEAPMFTVGGGGVDNSNNTDSGSSSGAGFDEQYEQDGRFDESVDVEGSNNGSLSSPPLHDGAGSWNKRRLTAALKGRSSPTKSSKATTIADAGGAADARALAWEAAASVELQAAAVAGRVDPTGDYLDAASSGGDGSGGAGTKRSRSESISSGSSGNSSFGQTIKSFKRSGDLSSQGTRISPTSVSDVNFMSFPVPHTEHSDIAMHHLPQQLAPSWCTKPQDSWMAGAGMDIGLDADDAGPFRWFIDERSLSAPGAFFHPPVEAWSDSDTTDASTSAGCTAVDGDHHHPHHQHRTVVPEQLHVSTSKVDMSPVGGMAGDNNTPSSDEVPIKPRSMMEPIVPMPIIDPQADIPVSDAAMANEVTRHVEADNAAAAAAAGGGGGGGGKGGGGQSLDITSGLWLDHPQEAHEASASSLMMYGLGLSAPHTTVGGGGGGGLGGVLSLPSLDEEEVLGFLACAEENNRPAGGGGGDRDVEI